MRKKNKKRLIIAIVILTFGLIAFVKFDYETAVNTPFNINSEETVSFFIKKGDGPQTIAANLKEEGLINSERYFYWYLRLNNHIPNILAGRFMLGANMTYEQIAAAITSAKNAEFVVTVQEGLRVKDIDKILLEMDLIEKGQFIEAAKTFNDKESYPFLSVALLSNAEIPLEGYLYPDTYFVDPIDFSSEKLIRKMLDNFKKKVSPKMLDDIAAQDKNLQQIITMASIIEKEVRTSKDLPIVSGILWKRLHTAGWTLGADATLLYEKDNNKITSADLASNSPYNSRRFGGLPPSAICNPSIESIKAAIYPEASDYWFYLTTIDTGEVIYAKSNEEHNLNRAKYLN